MDIQDILQQMHSISLSEMKGIKLMNRIDTKFIANKNVLCLILSSALNDYFVQEIEGQRCAHYDTLYYDTPALDMYLRHHDKQLCRQKIRTRTYIDSNLSFLEIKNKTNKGRTKKKRIPIEESVFWNLHNPSVEEFLKERSHYDIHTLTPQIRTQFNRITLVNKDKTERLTIDTQLKFENITTKKTLHLPHLMIIELKQDGMCHSQMKNILMEMRIKPTKISKYCIGTALTNPNVKHNRFNLKIRMIDKIENNDN